VAVNAFDAPDRLGPLELLVLQPTPFCNLDCSYCYLPDRNSRKRMRPEVLHQVFERVFASGLIEHPFTVVWHAGEPLVLPPRFYEEAFAIARQHDRGHAPFQHSFQSNATLLDEQWCDLIRAHRVLVGVSVDGPDFLHDRHRRTRGGRGTLREVLSSIRLLHDNAIPFHVITVLTADSLDYPDELFEFYQEHGIGAVGFNVEEIEGPHAVSSLGADGVPARFRRFLKRFFTLAAHAEPPMRVRELDAALGLILREGRPVERRQEATPLAIISIDCDGNFSTFSPELLGLPSARYGGFALGNVVRDDFRAAAATARFRAMTADVVAGVSRCRATCPYFHYCGGGAPANKYFENGSFDTTETLFCRLSHQAVLDVVLDGLERGELPLPAPEPGEGPPRGEEGRCTSSQASR
jgi:uncharacterized protein